VAFCHRNVGALSGIEPHPIADGKPSHVRLDKSSNAIEQGGFSRTGRAKQDREPRRSPEVDFQDELAPLRWQPLADENLEPRVSPFFDSFSGSGRPR